MTMFHPDLAFDAQRAAIRASLAAFARRAQ
jgi:hypothetical protein